VVEDNKKGKRGRRVTNTRKKMKPLVEDSESPVEITVQKELPPIVVPVVVQERSSGRITRNKAAQNSQVSLIIYNNYIWVLIIHSRNHNRRHRHHYQQQQQPQQQDHMDENVKFKNQLMMI
jgi:hypothetical protein